MAKFRVILPYTNPYIIQYGARGLLENKDITDWIKSRGITYIGYSKNTRANTVWTVTRDKKRHFVFGNKRISMEFKLKFS